MPANQSPLGALPARFRRERVLIVGCGDIGQRVARLLRGRVQMLALTSSPERVVALRTAGLRPLVGNLDRPSTLARLAGVATRVLHLAPPRHGDDALVSSDSRSTALVRALMQRSLPIALVYGSTSGVYGDCGGERIDETRTLRPQTARARRRVSAERTVRPLARAGVAVRVLRIPGIYAADRDRGTPRERLQKGTPVLRHEDDVFTNHIHADDLARACAIALWRGPAPRAFNVSDDSDMKMGDYFDLAADLYGFPRPQRIGRAEAQQRFSAMQLSFMSESRRLVNRRMKEELRLRLRYPDVAQGLRDGT